MVGRCASRISVLDGARLITRGVPRVRDECGYVDRLAHHRRTPVGRVKAARIARRLQLAEGLELGRNQAGASGDEIRAGPRGRHRLLGEAQRRGRVSPRAVAVRRRQAGPAKGSGAVAIAATRCSAGLAAPASGFDPCATAAGRFAGFDLSVATFGRRGSGTADGSAAARVLAGGFAAVSTGCLAGAFTATGRPGLGRSLWGCLVCRCGHAGVMLDRHAERRRRCAACGCRHMIGRKVP